MTRRRDWRKRELLLSTTEMGGEGVVYHGGTLRYQPEEPPTGLVPQTAADDPAPFRRLPRALGELEYSSSAVST
jgi:hypothetical protein